jgi:hypothetical protein
MTISRTHEGKTKEKKNRSDKNGVRKAREKKKANAIQTKEMDCLSICFIYQDL